MGEPRISRELEGCLPSAGSAGRAQRFRSGERVAQITSPWLGHRSRARVGEGPGEVFRIAKPGILDPRYRQRPRPPLDSLPFHLPDLPPLRPGECILSGIDGRTHVQFSCSPTPLLPAWSSAFAWPPLRPGPPPHKNRTFFSSRSTIRTTGSARWAVIPWPRRQTSIDWPRVAP